MEILKRLFNFNNDKDSIIGLCKFSDSFYKESESKEKFKKKVLKDYTLSEILKRPT